MDVQLVHHDPTGRPAALLAVPVFEGETDAVPTRLATLDEAAGGLVGRAFGLGDVRSGAEDRCLLAPALGDGPSRVLLLGVGAAGEFDAEAARRFAGRAVREAEGLRVESVSLWIDGPGGSWSAETVQGAAEGAVLAAWRFDELKSEEGRGDTPPPTRVGHADLVTASDDAPVDALADAVRTGHILADGENLARSLQSRPGNVATPEHLAEQAQALAETFGLGFQALGPAEMDAEGMGALLAVAAGSDEEPRLILLEYQGGDADAPPVALVGKGLTFDAGGISIKPALKMEEMKYDMSGGAAVLGAMRAIAELALPINVVGVVPASENLLNGSAVKPGDVIRTREGKTVEVINTDAEGRLILADALSFVRTYEPAAIVDCATLTGAVVIGLGHQAIGLLGTDERLIQEVRDAGDRAGERCWPLPLWPEYREQLDSDVADMKNVGGRPAGTITAAAFLREFVGDVPWVHLDVAGTAYGESKLSYRRKGALGVPTRLLVEWVRSRAR
jgi:leucyl aminopeptidase